MTTTDLTSAGAASPAGGRAAMLRGARIVAAAAVTVMVLLLDLISYSQLIFSGPLAESRAAGLSAELAAARLLLESSDVRLDYTLPETALPPELETALALTVREAITNVQRHARATRASVEVAADASSVRLVVADDGRGASIVPGNGLEGMRERLQALGGRLSIESASGQGTRLVAIVPLPAAPLAAMDVSRA